ncbi:hypothetical protein EMPS_05165 [Entomortierella parvispora]|uniref:Uncharacterized protein n=1 Tax=Entomortierella parvispora TaxID=205924 RepID=A0A9P3H9Y4_9FUNG|nr:hypothetical protein EMPS_05165 [Entomortierella parvispora]
MTSVLQSLRTRVQSMGLTFILGFLLCIFQSSESILVKLAGNRPEPHPSSAKLLFLAELLKLLISYALLSVERKHVVGFGQLLRRRCCKKGAKCGRSNGDAEMQQQQQQQQHQQLDQEERRGKRLLSDTNDDEDDDETEDIESPVTPTSTDRSERSADCSFPPILLFAVPGAIYFFNNNLTFVLLSLMPAPTYVVLSNLKILTTGFLSYLFLHRLLTTPQWISLGILFLSTAVSQVDLEKGLSLSISIQAFMLMMLFCSLSAFASVFSEYVMKDKFAKESIHLQNMKLYMFGILFNGLTYLLTPATATAGGAAVEAGGFWSDIAPIHFMIIMAYASLGLVTSAIIKFSGSITKVYASSMSMFFAALVSWLLLNDHLTVLFFVGCFGCCYALHLYYRAPSTNAATTSESSNGTAVSGEDEEELLERNNGESAGRHSTSSSSSTFSTTFTNSSPTSTQHAPLSSVKVVDRHEYLSLDTIDDHDDDNRR